MKLTIIPLMFLALVTLSCDKNKNDHVGNIDETAHGQPKHSYYTCTMHPQVHEHQAGNCPICGMPLVKVTGGLDENKTSQKNAATLLPNDYQKKVLQLTQGRVVNKEISFEIPAGGRHLSSSQVAFYIYESDLMRVKVGQQFEGECSSMPGITLSGKITQIDTVADPSSRSVRVIGSITSPHRMNLMEGSFFGKIKTNKTNALMVPYDSVLRTGKENLVYKIQDDGSLKATRVSVGPTSGDEIEITSGLSEGDLISFGPNFLIDSESRLKGHDSMNMEGM